MTAAHAQESVLYVSKSATCSDSGSGTSERPFCTAQAAADVVLPGQTVRMDDSVVGSLTIARSGTEGAPILFEGGAASRQASLTAPAILVRDAHDVVVRGMAVTSTSDAKGPDVHVTRSSRVVLDRLKVTSKSALGGGGGVLVDGGSSAVTLSRSALDISLRTIVVDGARDVTIAGNELLTGNGGIALANAPGAKVAGNTVTKACNRSVEVTGDAAGTSIQNNVFDRLATSATTTYCPPLRDGTYHVGVLVDAAAAAGVTTDYNIIYSGYHAYQWGDRTYIVSDNLRAATGQAAHDRNSDPQSSFDRVDSANADAPGQLDTDSAGAAPANHPGYPDTGAGRVAYQDRGAKEWTDTIGGSFTVSATKAPVGGELTATAAFASRTSPTVTCSIDFGDGSPVHDTCGPATHSYDRTGTFSVRAVGTSTWGSRTETRVVQIVKPGGSLAPELTATHRSAMTAAFTVADTASSWNVVKTTFDFGDGSAPRTVYGTPTEHHYVRAGTYTVTAQVTDAGGATATTSIKHSTTGAGFVAYGPARLLDTRIGLGAAATAAPYSEVSLTVGGAGTIPLGITAVALNVTVTNPTSSGYLTLYPSGTQRPVASTVNFVAGQTVPNMAIVPVGKDGVVRLFNGSAGTTDVIADLTGYFTKQPSADGFEPVDTTRVLDTRTGFGPGATGVARIAAGQTLKQTLAGGSLVPAGATAVALNVTAVDPAAAGFVTVYPAGGPRPTVSNVNYVGGQIIANSVVVPIGGDGAISYYSMTAVDLVVDVVGYFVDGKGGYLVSAGPSRAVDTRDGQGAFDPRETREYDLATTVPGVERLVTQAVLFNATAVIPTHHGFLTAFTAGAPRPTASILNFVPGSVVPNMGISKAPSGKVAFYNGSEGRVHLVVDVMGSFAL